MKGTNLQKVISILKSLLKVDRVYLQVHQIILIIKNNRRSNVVKFEILVLKSLIYLTTPIFIFVSMSASQFHHNVVGGKSLYSFPATVSISS